MSVPRLVLAGVSSSNDGVDDNTGSDGMSVIVNTKAMTATAKTFTNFSDNPGAYSWTDKEKDSDGKYTGFVIKLSAPVISATKADWWLVEEK